MIGTLCISYPLLWSLQKNSSAIAAQTKTRQVGLSKRVNSFASIMTSGTTSASTPSLPKLPGAVAKSITLQQLAKADDAKQSQEMPKPTKEKENKVTSIKDFLAKFTRK